MAVSPKSPQPSEQPPTLSPPAQRIPPLPVDRVLHPVRGGHGRRHRCAPDPPAANRDRCAGALARGWRRAPACHRHAGRGAAMADRHPAQEYCRRGDVEHPRRDFRAGRDAHGVEFHRRIRRCLAQQPGAGQPARGHVRAHHAPAQRLFRPVVHRHHALARGVRRRPGGASRPYGGQRGGTRFGAHRRLPDHHVRLGLATGAVLPDPDAAGRCRGHLCRAPHAPPEQERAGGHGRTDQCARREHQRPARGENFRRPGIRTDSLRPRGQTQSSIGGQARCHIRVELRRDHAADRDHAVVGDLFFAAAPPGRRAYRRRLRLVHRGADGDAVADQEPHQN